MIISFASIVFYGLIFNPPTASQPVTQPARTAEAGPSSTDAHPSTPARSNWQYQEQKDKMRNQTTRYASLESDNQLSFDFPYNGGSTGKLLLRISPKYGKNVILEVDKGQFLCSFEGCTVHVKFDNQPIVSYGVAEAADGSSNVVFIHNYAGFVKQLRQAKKLTIEAQFYQGGSRQLEFSPAGLNW